MLHAAATLLKASNPHMLRAVDGIDPKDESTALPSPHRGDPALHFWSLFGLSFEVLCTSTSAGPTSAATVQAIALEALLGLIRPDVAGTVLRDVALFDEVCNLCLRLAITEGPEIKARVLEIAIGLAQGFVRDLSDPALALNGAEESEAGGDDKLMQCLRIAVTVLRESIPAVTTGPKRASVSLCPCPPVQLLITPHRCAATAVNVALHVKHLNAAFVHFADLAELCPMRLRDELYAVALHSYSRACHFIRSDWSLTP